MKPALSTSEAARWLGISKSTLIRAVNRGDIQPAFRTPGRHLRFTHEAGAVDERSGALARDQ